MSNGATSDSLVTSLQKHMFKFLFWKHFIWKRLDGALHGSKSSIFLEICILLTFLRFWPDASIHHLIITTPLTVSLLTQYGTTAPLSYKALQSATFSMFDSCCWIALGVLGPQKAEVRVFANPETWMTHSLERTIRHKNPELDDMLSIHDWKKAANWA